MTVIEDRCVFKYCLRDDNAISMGSGGVVDAVGGDGDPEVGGGAEEPGRQPGGGGRACLQGCQHGWGLQVQEIAIQRLKKNFELRANFFYKSLKRNQGGRGGPRQGKLECQLESTGENFSHSDCQLSTVGEYFCKSTFSMMGIPLHHMSTGTLFHISINFLPVDNDSLSFYPPVVFNGECVNDFCH